MKSIHRLLIAATLAISATNIATATSHATPDKEEEYEALSREIMAKIDSQLSSISVDSLSDKVVYVRPDADDYAIKEFLDNDSDVDIIRVIRPTINIATVLGIIVPLTAIVAIVWIVISNGTRRRRQRYELIKYAINAGHPLPDSFYRAEMPEPKSPLRSGIVWVGWGVAIFMFFMVNSSEEIAMLGIIPFFIGCSRLACWWIDERNKGRKAPADSPSAQTLPPRYPYADNSSDKR